MESDPDPEAIDEPTDDQQQEAREIYWMLKETVAIGILSIFGVVLLAFGLMQATGLVSIPGPFGDSPIVHWAVFVAFGAVLVAAFAWCQWGT